MYLLPLLLIIFVLAPIVRGLVLCALWSWFVVATFHVPPLTVPVALGISILVALLTHQTQKKNSQDEETGLGAATVQVFAEPLICLWIGWIFKQFM